MGIRVTSCQKISKNAWCAHRNAWSFVGITERLHLVLQWPHTASIIQRSTRWQDRPVCDVIFWFPRFTWGVKHQPVTLLMLSNRRPIYSARKEFLGTVFTFPVVTPYLIFYAVEQPLKTIRGEPYRRRIFSKIRQRSLIKVLWTIGNDTVNFRGTLKFSKFVVWYPRTIEEFVGFFLEDYIEIANE